MKINEIVTSNTPTLFMPIGPSGSGKSTYFKKLKEKYPDINVFSLDILRHKWYDKEDYRKAWEASTKDTKFSSKANTEFLQLLDKKQNIYVDNTNLTPKSRKFYIQEAKKHGYKTVGIVFSVDLNTLIGRQDTRKDKKVPEEAVRKQYASMTPPTDGEFDKIIKL